MAAMMLILKIFLTGSVIFLHIFFEFKISKFLDSQRNGPLKFQLWKLRTFEATALQSGVSRKNDLCRENTYRHLNKQS